MNYVTCMHQRHPSILETVVKDSCHDRDIIRNPKVWTGDLSIFFLAGNQPEKGSAC